MDKPTLILALAIFMASAPNPDSEAIAEMTANFVVPSKEFNLQAAELPARQEEVLTSASSDDPDSNAIDTDSH